MDKQERRIYMRSYRKTHSQQCYRSKSNYIPKPKKKTQTKVIRKEPVVNPQHQMILGYAQQLVLQKKLNPQILPMLRKVKRFGAGCGYLRTLIVEKDFKQQIFYISKYIKK